MKKILLSASLLLAGMMTSYAQVPDASQWTKGQEITEQVGFGNPSFENDPFDCWTLKSSSGNVTNKGEGLFEIYNGADVDLYQYVQLPAVFQAAFYIQIQSRPVIKTHTDINAVILVFNRHHYAGKSYGFGQYLNLKILIHKLCNNPHSRHNEEKYKCGTPFLRDNIP
jgi:hypothetical protein